MRRESGIPFSAQVRQSLWFRRRIGATRHEYYYYRLYDETIPLTDRLAVLCRQDRIAIERLLNPTQHRGQIGGKINLKARLLAAGLPTPEPLGWFDPGLPDPHSLPGRFGTRSELEAVLSRAGAEGIALKLDRGYGGKGFMAFSKAGPDGLLALDGADWSVADLHRHLVSSGVRWLIERRARPHPALAAMHGDRLGTVRLHSMVFDSGRVETGFPIYRIPVRGNGADNLTAGNIAAGVDLATGVLGHAEPLAGEPHQDYHPATGAPIRGVQLPCWSETKDLVLRATPCLPGLRCLGWDIGLTDAGPVIIEVNASWVHETQRLRREGLMKGDFLQLVREVGGQMAVRRRAP